MKNSEWLKVRREFLKGKRNFEGYFVCEKCGKWTEHPEVDHIKRRGSHPELARDHSNLQILCNEPPNWCHAKKDSGMNVKIDSQIG